MEYNKRISALHNFYSDYLKAAFSTKDFVMRIKHNVPKQFTERIMLSVTNVNGCKMCSYYHIEEALASGMNQREIQQLLEGGTGIPADQAVGTAFAINYAESKGKINPVFLKRLKDTYGAKKAASIIAACRVIMVGNTLGIAVDRLKNKISFFREFFIFLGGVVLIPAFIVSALIGLLIPLKWRFGKQ